MNKFLSLPFFVLFSLFSLALAAQPAKPEFPTDPNEFMKELDSYMNAGKNEECKVAFNGFKLLVEQVTPVEGTRMAAIQKACNQMLRLKMRPNPYFSDFFNAVNSVLSNEAMAAKYFSQWADIASQIMDILKAGKYGDYNDYLRFSNDFFQQKALYFTPNGPIWVPTSTEGILEFRDNVVTVKYDATDLYCIRKEDTIYIRNTSGTYYPLEYKWAGKGAEVNWERTGLNGIKCTFDEYNINTKETYYKVKNATLYHPTLFDGPVKGAFEDKVMVSSKNVESQYPRFESFEKRLKLNDIGERIEYYGGFKLYGTQIFGYGESLTPAEILLYDATGRLAVRAFSTGFSIKKGDKILSDETDVRIYFGEDSIYHPGIEFRYSVPKHTLKLSQGDNARSKTPFFNSFQNIEMFVRTLEWNIDEPTLEIGKGDVGTVSRREVILESLNHFDTRRFEKYHNVSNFNDITRIVTFWRNLRSILKLRKKEDKSASDKKILAKLEGDMKNQVQYIEQVLEEVDSLQETDRNIHAERLSWLILKTNDVASIGRMLNDMVEDGLIFYDPTDKMVTLRDKLFLYNDAFINRVDFDIIRIKSVYSSPSNKFGYSIDTSAAKSNNVNAVLDFNTKTIKANWVRKIMLSDTQRVYVEPYDEQVSIYKNRNMDFRGGVRAGNSFLFGKDFHFNYDRFEINMDSVDYMEFFIDPREQDPETGYYSPYPLEDSAFYQYQLVIQTRLEKLKGILLIDAPNNKSGRDNIPIFPSFESIQKCFAYYDKPEIKGGAYKRDSFYFEVDPFIQDTLDHFDPNKLKFEGKLVSAGIFPEFREQIRVMWHDLSLGFETQTPKAGYPIYGGKGRFTKYFGISNYGLIGNGTVEYLVSKFLSDDIVFYPDSMTASSDRFKIEETKLAGVEYPKVSADSVKLRWYPYQDSMRIRSVEGSPFEFFRSGNYNLDGDVVLTPKGLYGVGTFDWEEATMYSQRLLFGANKIDSDTARVSIKSLTAASEDGQPPIAFDTENVKAMVDFDKKIGRFKSNTNAITTSLPFNKFKTSLDDFSWNMQDQTILLAASNQQNGSFLATDPKMDSLMFKGEKADYNLRTNLLRVDGVEFIPVADARVYPIDKHVEIEAGAEMDTLYSAKIVADTLNKYHVINRAKVKIKGKHEYEADGFYEYNVADKKQEIRFNDVRVKKKGKGHYVTNGSGDVAEVDKFIVDKKTGFFGNVKLSADSKNLQFDGYARLNTKVIPQSDWFTINSLVDRKNVEISYTIPYNPDKEKIYAGVFLFRDSAHLYTVVMNDRIKTVDRPIFTVQGMLSYVEQDDEFIFRDSTRIKTGDKYGNKMRASDQTGKIKCEGSFDLGKNFNGIMVQTSGDLETYVDRGDYSFKLACGVKMHLPDALADLIVTDLNGTTDVIPVDYTKVTHLTRSLHEMLRDEKRVDKIMKKVEETAKLDISADLGYAFFFPEFNLMWSDKQLSFFTKGSNLGIATIKGKPIDQLVRGYGEIFMTPRGDALTFSFESTVTDNKYYFSYMNGVLQTFSTNEAYNTAVTELKKKDKEIKLPDGSTYVIELAAAGAMNAFIRRAKDK